MGQGNRRRQGQEVVESIMQRFLVANTVRSLPSVRRSMAEDAIVPFRDIWS